MGRLLQVFICLQHQHLENLHNTNISTPKQHQNAACDCTPDRTRLDQKIPQTQYKDLHWISDLKLTLERAVGASQKEEDEGAVPQLD